MVRYILTALILVNFQIATAEEATDAGVQEQPAVDNSPKSFFESRTLEDVQQMVHSDVQFTNELGTEVSAPVPGNG
jgi:hypothetical protein